MARKLFSSCSFGGRHVISPVVVCRRRSLSSFVRRVVVVCRRRTSGVGDQNKIIFRAERGGYNHHDADWPTSTPHFPIRLLPTAHRRRRHISTTHTRQWRRLDRFPFSGTRLFVSVFKLAPRQSGWAPPLPPSASKLAPFRRRPQAMPRPEANRLPASVCPRRPAGTSPRRRSWTMPAVIFS